MPFSYTNRKGNTYYLHARQTKTGKTRYVFARSIGENPVGEIPDGYEVTENINGQVSLAKVRPRIISEIEEEAVRSRLKKRALGLNRVEVKHNAIIVHEPLRGGGVLDDASPFMLLGSAGRMEEWVAGGDYAPVLRFILEDEDSRTFHVERMTYRGHGGWSWALGSGMLADLAEKYLPHLGKESFFELM